MTQVFGLHIVYLHFAKPSVIKKRVPQVVENISKLGVNEVIFLHDECYSSFTSLCKAYGIEVPFKPTHYFEYLYNKLLDGKIKPLNIKAAYQRPCSSRLTEKDHFVDDIFELIGVERVEREYQGENALCCGGVIRMIKGREGLHIANDIQKRNVEDAERAGAEYFVFNCPYCYMALSEKVAKKGMKPIHMIDLCKLALGEKRG